MVSLISFSVTTYSQINFPVTADFQASFTSLSAPVNNTGADMTQFISANGGVSMVKCWDGAAPTWSHSISNNLQKDYAINGTTLGTVSDPDIVIEPINGDYVMLVYVLNGRIYYEIWNWNGADYSLFQAPTIVSGGNLGSNPNIDVNLSGEVAITWEEIGTGNEIYALVGNINGTGFGPATLITSDAQRPDIAISRRDGLGSSDVVISLTYIRLGTGVTLYQLDFNTLSSGLNTPISLSAYSINDFGWGSGTILGSFGYPSIASIHLLASAPFQAYHQQVCIAVDYQCTNGAIPPYTIYSMTRALTSTSPVTFNDNRQVLNKPAALWNQLNEKPVVTYAGEYITVAWNGDLNQSGPFIDLQDINSRRLNLNGNPWSNNTYSIVNQDVGGNQVLASVCGRHASGEVGFIFYSDFVTPLSTNTEVLFKESNSGATSYRIGQSGDQSEVLSILSKDQLEIYPNPAEHTLYIRTEINHLETSIYSLTGSLVKNIVSNAMDLHSIDIASLSPGAYILQVVGNGLSKRVPLVKIK